MIDTQHLLIFHFESNLYSECIVFRYLASVYAENHREMAKPHDSCEGMPDDEFDKKGGITNGARWYSVKGGESKPAPLLATVWAQTNNRN